MPALAEMLTAIRELAGSLDGRIADRVPRAEVAERLREEEEDVERALGLAQGLVLEARADDGLATPGQSVGVAVALSNNAGRGLEVEALELEAPAGWAIDRLEGETGPLAGAGAHHARFAVTIAPDARPSQPYWRRAQDRDRHELLVPADETRPWSPPALVARARCRIGGVPATLRTPVAWRYDGPAVGGERRHELQVVPALSLRLSPDLAALPLLSPREPVEVRVFARNLARGAAEAVVRLEAPPGWSVEPSSVPLRFSYEGEEVGARFRVAPPAALAAGTVTLRAVAVRDGREHRETVQAVDYDHVERRQLLRSAEARVLVLDLRRRPGGIGGLRDGLGRRRGRGHPPDGRPARAPHRRGPPVRRPLPVHDDRHRHPRLRDATGPALVARPAPALGRGGRPPRRPVQPRRLQPARPRGAASPGRRPESLRTLPGRRHLGADERRNGAAAPARPRPPLAHDTEPHRPRRLGGMGAGARDPVPGRARPALRGGPRRDRPVPVQPGREARDARRSERREGDVDLRRPGPLPAGPGRRPRRLAPPRQPRQRSEGPGSN